MRILAGMILSLFLGLMFVSLFHMSGSMDMSVGMSDCPFMTHEEVLCPMNLSDHITAWKSVFFTLIPPTITMLLVLGLAVFIVSITTRYIRKLNRHWISILILVKWRQLKNEIHSYFYRSHQELFARGILNPKLH
jgi:hypothetical protein